jgi:prepilin-type processing-associated H-X9-DG protein
MDTLTIDGEEALVISDERKRAPRRRIGRRALRWAVIAGVALPPVWFAVIAIRQAIQESRLTRCKSQIHELGMAMLEYQQTHTQFPAPAITARDGKNLLSWRVEILPQLGYQSLYERFRLDEPWDSPHNISLLAEMPRELACPGSAPRRSGQTGYLVVVGPPTDQFSVNTPFEPTKGADIRHITDGLSQTVLILETNHLIPWTKPDDLNWAPGDPPPVLASPHDGGSHVAFADGAVRFLRKTFNPQTFAAMLTINGSEVISGPG